VDGTTDKPYQLLAVAREAFWMHNYAEAETNYRDLIALEPDNPDGYGELGNMYFTRGNWEQAADAYFNAGKRLILAGRLQQAEVLVKVIRGLNGKQADELETLLNAASDTD
jgi:tetratricopeptide (TPR) repeat protein